MVSIVNMKLTMNEFDQRTFGEHVVETAENVREKLLEFAKWNRLDLAFQIYDQLADLGKLSLWPKDDPVLTERQIGSVEPVPARLKVPKKPLANPKHLVIHRHTVVAFLLAEPGHAFTGIAMVGHVNESVSKSETPTHTITRRKLEGRPKIFLMPVSPATVTTRQSTSKAYVPKLHATPTAKIYKMKVSGAISHKASSISRTGTMTATVIPGADAGHTQLVNLVKMKEKYRDLTQEDGHFVGFTVSKGVYAGLWKNRYAMTSLSSNAGAFAGLHEEETLRLYPNTEWRDEIMRACDNLLQLEADIHSLGLDIASVCSSILEFTTSKNDFWKSIKNTYWPCYNIAVSTQEKLDSDW